jgi:hypothetical protein
MTVCSSFFGSPAKVCYYNIKLFCRGRIQKTHFLLSSQIGRGCYDTQGWKGLPETNTLAYWVHLWVTEKIRFCENGPQHLKLHENSKKNLKK